jgi:hypothetical protein
VPFKSKAQSAACYAKRARGQAKGWDCDEWSDKTNYKRLPRRAKKAEAPRTLAEAIGLAAAECTLAGRGA